MQTFFLDVGLSFQRRKPYEYIKTIKRTQKKPDGTVETIIREVRRLGRDNFSRRQGREGAVERLNEHQMQIKLYSDETIDHAVVREIRKMTPTEADNHKIPRRFYDEVIKAKENPIPLHNVEFSINKGGIVYSITTK